MVAGYHVIFGMYGFWLPNDPRGSWSEFVGAWDLFRYGGATTTSVRHSVAGQPHDQGLRQQAKSALKRKPVQLTGVQARCVALAIGQYAEKIDLPIWACAVLPDHVHLVVGRAHLDIEQLVIQFKGAATRRMIDDGVHPFQGHAKSFARGEWKVYLDFPDISRAVAYVENNPIKEGLPRQRWSFVRVWRT